VGDLTAGRPLASNSEMVEGRTVGAQVEPQAAGRTTRRQIDAVKGRVEIARGRCGSSALAARDLPSNQQ
jgi:hypothetical protein